MIYDCQTARLDLPALIDLKGEAADLLPRLQHLGLPDPPPGRIAAAGALRLLRPAPSHWLLHAPLTLEDALVQQLLATAPAPCTLIVPVSDAYAWFGLRGAQSRELMAIGCPLDLDPQVFGADSASFTELFGLKALVCGTPDGYEIAVERSYGPLLSDWFARVQGEG